jgi:hypothetical protein
MADQEGLKQKFLQAIDQDDSLNADQKKEKKHKIEKEIAAGAITAGLGYEVIQIWPPSKLVLYVYPLRLTKVHNFISFFVAFICM